MRIDRREFMQGAGLAAAGLAAPFALGACQRRGRAPETFDVVVYGASSAGVAAAVQAARLGRSVILVEPTHHLGGLTSSGLGHTDSGVEAAIGGMSREFYQRVRAYYERDEVWKHETRAEYMDHPHARSSRHLEPDQDAQWGFEPHAARAIYEEMLTEANVPVVLGDRLVLQRGGVKKNRDRITTFVTEDDRAYFGRIFIDATYEGDLMAMAGVSYHVGREANSVYDENLNGVQKARTHNHVLRDGVDPYVDPGNPASGPLPTVHTDDPGEDGEGDHRVQAYCYRMCLTDVRANMVPFEKPHDYDEQLYELQFRNFEAGEDRIPWLPGMMPNRKTDTNNRWGVSTNYVGMNHDYPDAGYAERAAILAEHEWYQRGLMWTLAYHPRTPEFVREEVSKWGLAADEFVANNNWPPQIYVREARRMIGEYVMTENDCRRSRVAEDPVGLGSYNMDSHNVQRYITPEGFAQNEGNLEYPPGGPYAISYRSLLPQRRECTNLLVCCNGVSASHISFGSIRMEPVFMILGQSAAFAAHLALRNDLALHDVAYPELRTLLLEADQRIDVDLERWPPSPFED